MVLFVQQTASTLKERANQTPRVPSTGQCWDPGAPSKHLGESVDDLSPDSLVPDLQMCLMKTGECRGEKK